MAASVMSLLGHHLAQVNTVQLIAHPGHGLRAGGSISDEDFFALMDGLTSLKFYQDIDAVMTGYIGKAAQVDILAKTISVLHKLKPELDVMVDPAIGDHGRLYVDDDIARRIENDLIPLAHVITPNAYEFARLTGLEGGNTSALYETGQTLLDTHPKLKGIAVTGWAQTPSEHDGMISDYWIDRDGVISHDALRLAHNPFGMAGGGDLFAAILLAVRVSGTDWRNAFEDASRLSRDIINGTDKADTIDIDLSHVTRVLQTRN